MKYKILTCLSNFLFIVILLFSIIASLFTSQPVQAAVPQVIGSTVSISDSNVVISAIPSTLTASGWVEITFNTKNYDGAVDVVYGFNELDNVKAINPQVWESYTHTKYRQVPAVKTAEFKPTKIISVNTAALRPTKADTDLSLNSKYAEIVYEQTLPYGMVAGKTTQQTIKLAYDTYDSKTSTYLYKYNGTDTETYYETYTDWNPKSQPVVNTLSHAGANKWDVAPYKSVVKNEVQKTRVWIDIPFPGKNGLSGKYNIGIKPSSLTLQQAKDQGKLWLLDPWYDSDWDYKKSLVVDQTDDLDGVSYQMKLIVHYGGADVDDVEATGIIHTPNASVADFDDLRFANAAENGWLDYWIESSFASDNATVWVEVPLPDGVGDTTIYMYYGNAGAATASSGANTFIVFDDFERGSDGDSVGGSWSIDLGHVHISTEQDIGNVAGYTGTRGAKWICTLPENLARCGIPVTALNNIAIRFRYYKETAADIIQAHSDGTWLYYALINTTEDFTVHDGAGFVDTTLNVLADSWGLQELNNFNWTAKTVTAVIDGSAKTGIDISNASNVATNAFRIEFNSYGNFNFWIDDFIVRKWAANEPVWSAFGAEEAAPTTSCALTGTVTTATESNVVLGGKTIILTLTGDTWVAAGATFDAQRDDIITGMDSAQSEAHGWDADYKANAATYVANVVRTNDTVVTVTLSALGTYAITANETITVTVPATALTGAGAIVAAPTFVITHLDWACALAGTITAATTEVDITTGGKVITLTLTDATWAVAGGGVFDAQRQNIINGLTAAATPATGWNNEVRAKMAVGEVVRTNDTVVTVTLSALGTYAITAQETITATVPATAVNIGIAIIAAPTFTVDALAPVISTVAADTIANVTANLKGTVDDLKGGGNVTIHGFGWDTVTRALWSDYANNPHTHSSIGVSAFNEPIAGLTAGTKYYFNAYGTSPLDTSQGSELTFLTLPPPPTAFTATATSDTQINLAWTKAVCGAGVTVNTYVRANLGAAPTFSGAGGTTVYDSTLAVYNHAGLTTGQHWFYRAWTRAVIGGLEQYSDPATFVSGDATTFVAPTVTTGICSGSGTTWAILNGNVTATGIPTTVTQTGFEYGLTTGYGSLSPMNVGSFGTGAYFSSLTGLSPSTIYHYRAIATNGAWGNGADAIFATKGSPAITTYFNVGSDNCTPIYGVNTSAQTFTTSATTEYTVTSIRLEILRVLSPGTITVSIRRATAGAGNVPTGIDITSGTLNCNTIGAAATWYDIPMATETTLELNSTYAVVVSAPSGDVANYVCWRKVNAGGFANGNGTTSVNSSITWTATTWDQMFELWGNQALEIQDAKVFQSYKETGDWLVVVRYINIYAPYCDDYDIKRYFTLQLVDSIGIIKAANVLPEWGNKVASTYLSAASAFPLTPGGNYRVRIQGTFTGAPYTEYTLLPADWVGSDMINLDSWVIKSSASVISKYYSLPLTTDITGMGEVLNALGASVFSAGIPSLSSIRPNIYGISSNPIIPPAPAPNTVALQSHYIWQQAVGPQATILLSNMGVMLGGVSGDQVGQYLIFILWALIAGFVYPPGHTMAAFILDSPLLIWSIWVGFTSLTTMGIMLFLMILLLLFQLILKGAS